MHSRLWCLRSQERVRGNPEVPLDSSKDTSQGQGFQENLRCLSVPSQPVMLGPPDALESNYIQPKACTDIRCPWIKRTLPSRS